MNCSSTILEILDNHNINGHDKPGGTDKNTNHTYVEAYGELLAPFVGRNGALLEIGVQYGGSSLLWHELLNNFYFLFVDNEDKIDPSVRLKLNHKRYNYYIEDGYSQSFKNKAKNLHPGGFEVIIDDGPHTLESQKKCVEMYIDMLKVNGIMVIEDIQDVDTIKEILSVIPDSEIYDYKPRVFDLRDKKNRYDDVILVIKKVEKVSKNNIGVFYHLGQFGQWERLFQEQMNSLVVSGLYHAASFIHIGVNGKQELPMYLDKFNVVYNQDQVLEADTLKSLWDFSRSQPNFRVMYFHTKGSTQENTKNRFNVDRWRLYLEYFTIHQWKVCIEKLKTHDTVGTEYSYETGLVNQNTGITEWETNPHYAGNYWWANASYVRNLDPNFLYNTDKGWTRYRSEFWIGTGNPKKYNFFQTNCFDKYRNLQIVPTDYVVKQQYVEPNIELSNDMLLNKKSKFVMITMFKNEAKTIGRMLESCYKFIDYYVIQDNGSTDGTPEIVENFFKDKNIPGFVYKVEEGWVGFGWNRDHLLQKCQSTDHGCDWIMKMDCDEILQVDQDFDWSVFDDKNLHSFHVPAVAGSTIYQRAWIWNAKLQWKFNHDTAHETIELLTDGIGSNFRRFPLSTKFKHIGGFDDGESWQSPTKYVSDALKLEEKLIRENTLLTDLYHFWYVGKSYYDAFKEKNLPLKEKHSQELARRSIFNFVEFINHTHQYDKTGKADRIDEMGFYAMMLIGNCYQYLKDYENAEKYLKAAAEFCPVRNENYLNLAFCYQEMGRFDKMLEVTTFLMDPSRKNPFPDYTFIIDQSSYYDTGDYVKQIHEFAVSKNKTNFFRINNMVRKRLWVVDNFYEEPDKVREFALNQIEYAEDNNWYKGFRSKEQYNFPGIKEAFEGIMGMKLKPLDTHGMCGRFQTLTAEDKLVYHVDSQKWAAMVYLTPNPPIQSGTLLLRSIVTGARHADDDNFEGTFDGGFYDKTKFEVVDTVGNVYNRLVIFDSRCIHAAAQYFGNDKHTGRLTHLFFFDDE